MKRSPLVFLALLAPILSGCSSLQKSPSLENPLVRACERLVNYYPIPRDSLDGPAYGEMFTEDGEFILSGTVTKGRERIVDNLLARSSNTSTRHVTGSVNVTAQDGYTGSGISYALVFSSADISQGQPKKLDQQSLLAVVSYLDKFKFENGECFFSQRKVLLDFLNASDAGN